MNTSIIRTPVSALDPYTDQALLDPWPLYRELREMGPVVWLEKHGMLALTHYDVVVQVLRDWEAFPSSFGVMMNDDMNQVLRGNTLCGDFGRSPFVRGSRACGKRWIPPRDVRRLSRLAQLSNLAWLRLTRPICDQPDTVIPRRTAEPASGGAEEAALVAKTQQIGCVGQ